MRFLKLWKETGRKFVKPKFRWFIGRWSRESNLPVWRHGNVIRFGKYEEKKDTWDGYAFMGSDWNELGRKNHPFLSKFLKPYYVLPDWLSFYFFNQDIGWKTREEEDDFRYEHPAHITLVLFGLCVSVTACVPESDGNDWTRGIDYWESLLTYRHYNGDLRKTNEVMGWWGNPGKPDFKFRFNPEFLTDIVDKDDLIALQAEQLEKMGNEGSEESE